MTDGRWAKRIWCSNGGCIHHSIFADCLNCAAFDGTRKELSIDYAQSAHCSKISAARSPQVIAIPKAIFDRAGLLLLALRLNNVRFE
jgi:hypothetical protein